jgi:DNA repair exonuclease SbcCD ATPase subunit
MTQKERLEKEIEDNIIKIVSFEEQIKELKVQLDDIKRKSAEVTTEKEIFALQTEEHIAKDKLTYANEEIDRLNKVNNVKKEQLKELEEEIKQKQQELEEIKKEVDEEFKKIEEQKHKLLDKREEIISNMDRRILAFYEKIRKWAFNYLEEKGVMDLARDKKLFVCLDGDYRNRLIIPIYFESDFECASETRVVSTGCDLCIEFKGSYPLDGEIIKLEGEITK